MKPTTQITQSDKARIKEITTLIDSVFIRQCRVNNWLKYIIQYSRKNKKKESLSHSLERVQQHVLDEYLHKSFTMQEDEFITVSLNDRIRSILEGNIQQNQCPTFGLECFNIICSKLYPNFIKEKECSPISAEMLATITECKNMFDAYCIYQFHKIRPNTEMTYPLFVERNFTALQNLFKTDHNAFIPHALNLGIHYEDYGFDIKTKRPIMIENDYDYLPF